MINIIFINYLKEIIITMEQGYTKANSSNLPMVNSNMVSDFFLENTNFSGVEMRGKKLLHSARESYGDNSVGFVQLKREGQLCTLYARITPEHKVREKGYLIKCEIDEGHDSVQSCICEDCPASEGGCKHAVAFLLWLHRRSEEPSVTSVTCYWKKSKMTITGGSRTFIRAQDLCRSDATSEESINIKILNDFVNKVKDNCQAGLLHYLNKPDQSISVGIHGICATLSGKLCSATSFMSVVKTKLTSGQIEAVFCKTKGQSESPLWFELRYARITGSILHEAAHCKTKDGTLINKIMGQKCCFASLAMTRGKQLEKEVLKIVGNKIKIKIQDAGLMLHPDYPILGATPDGLTDEYVVEVKCPSTEKAVQSYIKNYKLQKKFWTQIQSQMFFCNKKMGLLCVAEPDFETSKIVNIYYVPFDPKIVAIMEEATLFWVQNIFPKLKQIYSLH